MAVADRRARLLSRIRPLRAVDVEVLAEARHARVQLELVRHARHVVDDGADGVAGIRRRERPVEHVDALDLLGSHEAPARRERCAVAEQVRDQDPVDIDERPGAVVGTRSAGCEHGMVVIADVTLANDQAREILQRVLGVGRVDSNADVLAVDALDRGRNLRRQRRRPPADDRDGAELTARLLTGAAPGHRRRGRPTAGPWRRRSPCLKPAATAPFVPPLLRLEPWHRF